MEVTKRIEALNKGLLFFAFSPKAMNDVVFGRSSDLLSFDCLPIRQNGQWLHCQKS